MCLGVTWLPKGRCDLVLHLILDHRPGHNLLGVASKFATQNPGSAIHCCICVVD